MGWLFFGERSQDSTVDQLPYELSENTVWTCAMDPQVRMSEPGKCPVCGMKMIPLDSDFYEENPMMIKMSPTAMQLANVQTSIITKQIPVKKVRMNGKVKADERNIFSQSSHIPGRIEKTNGELYG